MASNPQARAEALQALQQLHAQIGVHLDALDRLTGLPAPSLAELSPARLALTRASRARAMLIERLHSDLDVRADARGRAALEALRADAKAGLVTSAHHIAEWTPREITARWSEYCEASRAMRAAMRKRVAREIEILYPLLSSRTASPG